MSLDPLTALGICGSGGRRETGGWCEGGDWPGLSGGLGMKRIQGPTPCPQRDPWQAVQIAIAGKNRFKPSNWVCNRDSFSI